MRGTPRAKISVWRVAEAMVDFAKPQHETLEQSEYLDVSYIENWSIAGDLAILAKTVMVIFTGRGSY